MKKRTQKGWVVDEDVARRRLSLTRMLIWAECELRDLGYDRSGDMVQLGIQTLFDQLAEEKEAAGEADPPALPNVGEK